MSSSFTSLRFVALGAVLPLTVGISLLPLIAMLLGSVVAVGHLCSCYLWQSGSTSTPPLLIPVQFSIHLFLDLSVTFYTFFSQKHFSVGLLCLVVVLSTLTSRTSQLFFPPSFDLMLSSRTVISTLRVLATIKKSYYLCLLEALSFLLRSKALANPCCIPWALQIQCLKHSPPTTFLQTNLSLGLYFPFR